MELSGIGKQEYEDKHGYDGSVVSAQVASVMSEPPMDRHASHKSIGASTTRTEILEHRKGRTPTGGSECQQSSLEIMWVLFVCTAALLIGVVKAAFSIRDMIDEEEGKAKAALANANNSTGLAAFLVAYENEKAASSDPSQLCDVAYFADPGNAQIFNDLVDSFELLNKANEATIVLGTLFVVIYLLTKFLNTFELSVHINREERPLTVGSKRKFRSIIQQNTGHAETLAQRRTRVYLRNETLGYLFVQIFQDVPLLTYCAILYWMGHSQIGTKCAECYVNREICTITSVPDVDLLVKVTFGLVILSLIWNALLLWERWIQWIKFKAQLFGQHFNPRRYLIFAVFFSMAYVLIAISPMMLLYFFEFGPTYFNYSQDTLWTLEVFGFTGVGFQALLALVILGYGAGGIGEALMAPVVCCEVCDAFGMNPCDACICCCC